MGQDIPLAVRGVPHQGGKVERLPGARREFFVVANIDPVEFVGDGPECTRDSDTAPRDTL
ncbi:MAG TPA: hypothetical protein DEB39_16235 [Planctomycetaceae bacterium]|nr:hypothetical protein [Planctomycetaceae bacterium]